MMKCADLLSAIDKSEMGSKTEEMEKASSEEDNRPWFQLIRKIGRKSASIRDTKRNSTISRVLLKEFNWRKVYAGLAEMTACETWAINLSLHSREENVTTSKELKRFEAADPYNLLSSIQR